MRMLKRRDYNNEILARCVELLKSRDSSEIFEAVVNSAYLIEQAFKCELKKINPLLYFDTKDIGEGKKFLIAIGKLPIKEYEKLKTVQVNKCITQMCVHKKDIVPHKANIEELFLMRNFILHSVEDFYFNADSASESAVSALKACQKYIARFLKISPKDISLLTSSQFEKLQEEKYEKRLEDLKLRLVKHKGDFDKFKGKNIYKGAAGMRLHDNHTWVEEVSVCPACNQISLNKLGGVDFDWNPDGVLASGGYDYYCDSCGLELSEYEYEMAQEIIG